MKKLFAEFFGTYWVVFGGCGSALFAAGIPDLGIGIRGSFIGFWLNRFDHGICCWTYLRRAF